MKIVAVVCRKGGTGKTATVQALGAGLIGQGQKVLFVDLDSQMNLSFGFGADCSGVTVYEVLTEGADIEDVIQHTESGDILPASESLATITHLDKSAVLKQALDGLDYDYVIIDTPAQIGAITIEALQSSQDAILVAQSDVYSLQGISQIYEAIKAVREHNNKDLTIQGILISRFNSRSVLAKDFRKQMGIAAQEMGSYLYDNPIPECVAVKEAQAMQTNIFDYAPKSTAAYAYAKFIDQYLQNGFYFGNLSPADKKRLDKLNKMVESGKRSLTEKQRKEHAALTKKMMNKERNKNGKI